MGIFDSLEKVGKSVGKKVSSKKTWNAVGKVGETIGRKTSKVVTSKKTWNGIGNVSEHVGEGALEFSKPIANKTLDLASRAIQLPLNMTNRGLNMTEKMSDGAEKVVEGFADFPGNFKTILLYIVGFIFILTALVRLTRKSN